MPDEKNNDEFSSTQKIPKQKPVEIKLIPVVCSWCKKIYKLSEWEVEQKKQTGVSHGICPECLEKYQRQQNDQN